MTKVTRREWMWAAAVAGLVVVASTLPVLAGYLAQTPQQRFSGVLLDRMDYHSHLAKMWQGYRGEWKYRLLFTPEDHEGVYLQTFYVALGHLARVCGLSLPLTYQISRVVFGFLMLLTIYRFIAYTVGAVRTRRVAFLLATTASGLGWLTEIFAPTPPGGVSPMDFWLLSGFTYLAVLTSPHFCAATTLLLTVFSLLLSGSDGPSLREGALAVAASLGLGIIHPYALLLADLLPLLYWLIEALRTKRVAWRGLATLTAMGLAQVPLLIYDVWVFRTQPIFAGWSAQNITLSPPPRIYLCGYGIPLALGVVGVVTWTRRRDLRLSLPLLWIGLVAVLIHLPWNLQRRFLEGVQVPLGLLAGVGLAEGLLPQHEERERQTRWRWFALALLVALAAMSNILLTTALTSAAATPASPLFWSRDLLDAVDWLGENTWHNETVLAGPETGSLIVGRTGHRVVIGHGMETVDYETKLSEVTRFFSDSTSDGERLSLLREWEVAYILHGSEERILGAFDPAAAPWLTAVFSNGEVDVYRPAPEG